MKEKIKNILVQEKLDLCAIEKTMGAEVYEALLNAIQEAMKSEKRESIYMELDDPDKIVFSIPAGRSFKANFDRSLPEPIFFGTIDKIFQKYGYGKKTKFGSSLWNTIYELA